MLYNTFAVSTIIANDSNNTYDILVGEGTTTSLDGGNIRYYGASHNNYIYFNCSDYNNQTSDTCELWRIIGVFNNQVKIMRNESIGAYSWDTSSNANGLNN